MAIRALNRGTRLLFLTVVGLACLGPILWVVLSSFKTQGQIYGGGSFLPNPVSFDGYRALFTEIDILRYYLNTLLYAGLGTLGALASALLAAYPAARMEFPFRRSLTALFTLGLAIPITGLIVPEFVIMRELGLYDSLPGMIVFYSAMWFPLAFVILRAYLSGLPPSLEEAAALDGAGYFQLIWRIIIPLARPGLATAGVLVFINVWNDFLFNLLLAPSPEHQNVQVSLALFRGHFTTDISAILAGTTLMMIVPVICFLFLQRQVIAGLTTGAAR
ncbi:MAG TPA: carbohydrate ABC transporter permease [Solirubrobacterales bacterium]|nr:carbohydrate ABC transporter permease [Solirubrobacterales bacterium]